MKQNQIEELLSKREEARLGGGEDRIKSSIKRANSCEGKDRKSP